MSGLPQHPVPPTAVSIRDDWADPWTPLPHVHLDRCTFAVGHAVGTARFSYEYGRILREGTLAYADFTRLVSEKRFIKAEWAPNDPTPPVGAIPATWYGFMLGGDDQRIGTDPILSGNQHIPAMSLEWAFTREQITTAIVEDGTSGGKTIERAIGFNMGDGYGRGNDKFLANRQPTKIGSHYHFAADLTTAVPWTVPDILEYLLLAHNPFTGGLDLEVHADSAGYLAWLQPRVPVEKRTVWDVLNQVIDRRRGVTWSLGVERTNPGWDETSKVYLVIHSYVDVDIDDGATPTPTVLLPANANQVPLVNDGNRMVESQVVRKDRQQRYRQILLTGARRGAMFTMANNYNDYEPDWTTTEETNYGTGDPNAPGAADVSQQQALNDAWRLSDRYAHVYTRFRLPQNWDGLAKGHVTCPELDANGDTITPVQQTPFWWAGLRLSNTTRLREGFDYTDPGSPIAGSGLDPPFRKIFGVLTDGSTWATTEQLRSHTDEEIKKWKYTARVAADPYRPAVICFPSGRPHQQALTHFVPATAGPGAPEYKPVFNWQNLKFTVLAEWDAYVQVRYPGTPLAQEAALNDVLVIDLGDQYRLDWVTEETVLDVVDGSTEQIASVGGYVRDDRPQMKNLARIAWAFYGRERVSAEVLDNYIDDRLSNNLAGVAGTAIKLHIGSLLSTLDGDVINSLVTTVTYDFTGGQSSIGTDFARLDVRGFRR